MFLYSHALCSEVQLCGVLGVGAAVWGFMCRCRVLGAGALCGILGVVEGFKRCRCSCLGFKVQGSRCRCSCVGF